MNTSAFNTVAGGAGFNGPIGPHEECTNPFYESFIPPGRAGEALGGEGDPITYPEVQSLGYRCSNVSVARTVLSALEANDRKLTKLRSVGDEADFFNVASYDPQSYPNSRVFAVYWRRGNFIGFVVVAGPPSDTRIGPGLVELLAGRAAASS